MWEVLGAAEQVNVHAFQLVHGPDKPMTNNEPEFKYQSVGVRDAENTYLHFDSDAKRLALSELGVDLCLGDAAEHGKLYSVESARSISVRCSLFLKATQVSVEDFSRTDSVGYGLIETLFGFTCIKELRGVFVRDLAGTGIVLVNIFTWPSCKRTIEEKIAKFAALKDFTRTVYGHKVTAWVEIHQDDALRRVGYDPSEKVKCTPEEAAKAAEKAATAATAAVRAAMETSNLQFHERLSSLAETTVGVEAANASMAERAVQQQEQQQARETEHSAKLLALEAAHKELLTELAVETAKAEAAKAELVTAMAKQVSATQSLEERMGEAFLRLSAAQTEHASAQANLMNSFQRLDGRVEHVEIKALNLKPSGKGQKQSPRKGGASSSWCVLPLHASRWVAVCRCFLLFALWPAFSFLPLSFFPLSFLGGSVSGILTLTVLCRWQMVSWVVGTRKCCWPAGAGVGPLGHARRMRRDGRSGFARVERAHVGDGSLRWPGWSGRPPGRVWAGWTGRPPGVTRALSRIRGGTGLIRDGR